MAWATATNSFTPQLTQQSPIHADLQLARNPRVAAHTPPQSPIHTDQQLAKKPQVAAHTPPAKPDTFEPATCKEAVDG